MKEKHSKLDFPEVKNFPSEEDAVQRMRRQAHTQRKKPHGAPQSVECRTLDLRSSLDLRVVGSSAAQGVKPTLKKPSKLL